jgi:hypothetical protein
VELPVEPLDIEPLDIDPFDMEPFLFIFLLFDFAILLFDIEPFDMEPLVADPLLDIEPLDIAPLDWEPLDIAPLLCAWAKAAPATDALMNRTSVVIFTAWFIANSPWSWPHRPGHGTKVIRAIGNLVTWRRSGIQMPAYHS